MDRFDLRQIGTVIGLPIYVDLSSVRDFKEESEVLSARDLKELQVRKILQTLSIGKEK